MNHIPLPRGAADALLAHVASCRKCTWAKIYPRTAFCTEAHNLVKQALRERHGEVEER